MQDVSAEAFHDAMQYAVKILMNSHGVFASGFIDLHTAIWAPPSRHGRARTSGNHFAVEDEGHGVVYSDTDSIFVRARLDPPRLVSEGDRSSQRRREAAATLEAAKQ